MLESTTASAPREIVQPDPAVTRPGVGWRGRIGALGAELASRWEPYQQAVQPVTDWIGRVIGCVTSLGWLVLASSIGCWLAAIGLGWGEFAIMAAAGLALFVLCCLFAIGRQSLGVQFELNPIRVSAGESAAVRVSATNTGRAPLMPLGLEFPVGKSVARFTLPTLMPGHGHEELLVIPTTNRGVIGVGPVVTHRGDPFGLVRRQVVWVEEQELFVHPRTVALDPVGFGLLRDLEGHTTNDVSMSDLAFHTLREYVPGDDRRYIHWRSSAKLSGTASAGKFLVRQFLDTRRSHIAVVLDANSSSYRDDDEFELAISAGASVALRTLIDEMDLTIVCGEHVADKPRPAGALDVFSRAEYSKWDLASEAAHLVKVAPDASVVVFISGSEQSLAAFRQARAFLPPEVHAFAVRADLDGEMSLKQAGNLTVVGIGELGDLPKVLIGGQLQ